MEPSFDLEWLVMSHVVHLSQCEIMKLETIYTIYCHYCHVSKAAVTKISHRYFSCLCYLYGSWVTDLSSRV